MLKTAGGAIGKIQRQCVQLTTWSYWLLNLGEDPLKSCKKRTKAITHWPHKSQ